MPKKTKTTARKSAPRSVPALTVKMFVSAIKGAAIEVHAHPHLVQIHDCDSVTGAKLAPIHITFPRGNDDAATFTRKLRDTLESLGCAEKLRVFDVNGNPVA